MKNLCSAAIEEANWDVAAWQEANILALGLLLGTMFSVGTREKDEDDGRRRSKAAFGGEMEDWLNREAGLKLELVDVGRAPFHARARGNMYNQLPEQRRELGR